MKKKYDMNTKAYDSILAEALEATTSTTKLIIDKSVRIKELEEKIEYLEARLRIAEESKNQNKTMKTE